jgi:chromosomal replication initiator protein
MTTIAAGPRQLWEAALGHLQLLVTRPNYDTWLKHTVGKDFRNGLFVVGTPNAFVSEMLEQRMYSIISQTLERVVESPVEIRFEVVSPENTGPAPDPTGDALPAPLMAPSPADAGPTNGPRPAALNPKYTFSKFIVGKSNDLAHAAAMGVAQKPGELYNPLVMYADVGLGKTHLMQAIGHAVAERGLSLIYATTEEFTNSYIKAIREGTTETFREHYRTADVLLLDDLQFLIGKEQTQEGFFHTFNALHMTNRQIVLTSDRPVSALKLLEDRIQSRLTGGLVVDIQTPDVETRIAILRSKAEGSRQRVCDDALLFLAERVHRNIRELEGSLNRVLALADLTAQPVTIDLVRHTVSDVGENVPNRQVPELEVVKAVASYFGLEAKVLKGRKRDKKSAKARQVAMYLLREESRLNLSAIGSILGGKAHNTVKHGCDRITNELNVDPNLRRDIINIRTSLSLK